MSKMKITIETTPQMRECKRGKKLELNDELKQLIKDQIYIKIHEIWDLADVEGMLKDVLITFDDTEIKNIEF